LFHYNYERLAPRFGYSTRPESAVPWDDVPQPNRDLMVAVVQTLVDRGVIVVVDDV
jgi:hypothetical protein